MKKVLYCSLLALWLAACAPSSAGPTPTSIETDPEGKEVMNLQLTVVVTEEAARALHGLAPATPESQELLQAVEQLGLVLEPMHPGVEDPTLIPFFTVEVSDTETAQRVADQLLQLPAVEGAYTKPPDEMP